MAADLSIERDYKPTGPISRREFMLSLGIGFGAVITGYIVGHCADGTETPPSPAPSFPPARPRLRADIVRGLESDMMTLRLPAADSPLCAVNQPGRLIVEGLDGGHTVEDLASKLAEANSKPCTETVNASVAQFIAQLGMLGFLSSPYYVRIIERTEV